MSPQAQNGYRLSEILPQCEIAIWLLVNTNRKAHMGRPTVPLDYTLNDLERSNIKVT